jgi:peptidoglycan/LPS O-acetylase OafA/YrhL
MKKEGLLGILAGFFAISSVSAAWTFTEMLNQWQSMGVFDYALPFLLIFALVYAILTKSSMFGDENRGAVVIIALAVGLLSLVGNYVPNFFHLIMPNLGIGLAVLLVGVIMIGLVWNNQSVPWLPKVLLALGGIIFIFIIYGSFSGRVWDANYMWGQYGSALITLLILVGIIAAVVGVNKSSIK